MKASKITAADFLDDLASPYARRWFIGAFLVLILVSSSILYFLEDGIPGILTSVLTDVASGALIILICYWLYFKFIGPPASINQLNVVRPQDIKAKMRALPEDTSEYIFWGRSGSYLRSHPLIEIDKRSREEKRTVEVEIVLPDPTESQLVESYNGILEALGENSDGNALLANVLATSITCAVISANNKFVRTKLYYSKFLPAFRVDISDAGAILTQDDPRKSALFFEPDSEFYEMFRTTVRNEELVSRQVKLDLDLFKGRKVDRDAVDEAALGSFGLRVQNTKELQDEVAGLLVRKAHRYK